MKLKILALASILLSANIHAEENNKYFQFGFEKIDIEKKDVFNFSGNNFVNFTFGYHLSEYFALELGASVPVTTDVTFTKVDTFRVWDGTNLEPESFSEIQTKEYETKFSAKAFGRVGARVELPINDRFSFFSHVGYSAVGWEEKGYNFVDSRPPQDISAAIESGMTLEQLTALDSVGNAVTVKQEYDGLSYGAGFRFNYINGSNISVGYTKYISDDEGVEIDALSVNYGWRF